MHQKLQAVLSEQIINRIFISIITFVSFVSGYSSFGPVIQTDCRKRDGLDPRIDEVIEEFRYSVRETMKKGKVPGCAIALVDDRGIIRTEGFGYTDSKIKNLVRPDTPFLICSMSKAFTATAIMMAVQDGLLELDEPITTYLPDFKVYSRYEKQPEHKVTLRHLLSHTAGIPHESAGCNMLEPTGSFEDRAKSLYGTWLKCPINKGTFEGKCLLNESFIDAMLMPNALIDDSDR